MALGHRNFYKTSLHSRQVTAIMTNLSPLREYLDIWGRVDRYTVSALASRVALCGLSRFDDWRQPLSLHDTSGLWQSSRTLKGDIDFSGGASSLADTPAVIRTLDSGQWPDTRYLHNERLSPSTVTSGVHAFDAG